MTGRSTEQYKAYIPEYGWVRSNSLPSFDVVPSRHTSLGRIHSISTLGKWRSTTIHKIHAISTLRKVAFHDYTQKSMPSPLWERWRSMILPKSGVLTHYVVQSRDDIETGTITRLPLRSAVRKSCRRFLRPGAAAIGQPGARYTSPQHLIRIFTQLHTIVFERQ
jgi:hypothetical protein